jgi:hypothetical protein
MDGGQLHQPCQMVIVMFGDEVRQVDQASQVSRNG